jgi:uncharacterized protein
MFADHRMTGERTPAALADGGARRPLVIYHANCFDGFTAAWAAWNRFQCEVDFHAATHGEPPPDVTGRDVFILDFCYPRATLEAMANAAHFVVVLDHHKTAQEALAGVMEPLPFFDAEDLRLGARVERADSRPPLFALFDMNRSGAGIAWDFFFPDKARPALVSHVEDRDLWRFAMKGTREVQAALSAHPFDFWTWSEFATTLRGASGRERILAEGAAILRKHDRDVAQLVATLQRRVRIRGHEVWAANIPFLYTSDAGNLMAVGAPFAACYWDTPDGRVWSLRSDENGADVAAIAQTFGGGGHKHAAGFTLPLSSATRAHG